MLKETITYTDYNGNEITEDFYFNLNKAELMELELGTIGGLSESIKKIINAKDTPSIIKIFKKLLLQSYGEKSDDGKRFVKSEELSNAFAQTEAYSQMFMDLATDDKKAIKFIKGIVPKDMSSKVTDENVKKQLPNAKK